VATVSSVTFSSNVSATDNVIFQQVPTITWATPAPIIYGTALSSTQLDATSLVAGSFAYSPTAGTVLAVGQQTLSVTFTPNDTTDYTPATASVTLTVKPGTPVITVTSSANPVFQTYAVTLTASLPSYASSETGTMTFYDGSTQLGSAVTLAGGAASVTTSALAAGVHSITAVYSGDANYGPATSSAFTQTIQDFTLTFVSGNGSVTVAPGGVAQYSLIITPLYGSTLPKDVTLTASNVPLDMKAAISSVTLPAGSPTTTFTVDVNLPKSAANQRPALPFGRGSLPVALGLLLLPWARRIRRAGVRLTRIVVLALLAATLASGLSSCGGTGLNPQQFSFTVTGTSGTLIHSVSPQLTVK
jgi:hypothetical protein